MSSDGAGIVFQEDSITIQHDWQRSLETEKDKFFVNFKKYGEKTISYDVQCEKGKLKGEMDATGNVKVEVDGTSIKLVLGNVSKKFIAPFREFRNLHKTSINSIDISQTENLMVSSDSSSELFVHDAKIGKRLRELEGHIYDVYSCKFFPSGLIVLSGGMDMTVRIYSVEDGWNARTMKGHKAAVHDLGIIGEGVDVASCSRDGTCKIWNCASGNFTQDIQPEIGQLHGLALSDTDLHFIGLGGESNKAVVYDLRSNEKCFDFDVDSSCSTVVFDSGMHFYAGTSQGTLYSFDLRNKNPETIVRTQRGNVHKLKFNGIFGILASFHDGTVAAFKLVLENGKSYLEFTGSDCDPVYDLSISGNSLVTACRDKAIRKYNLDGIKIDS